MRRGIYRLCLVLFAAALFAVPFAAHGQLSVEAGPNQTVTPGAMVTLSGSGTNSGGVNDDGLAYRWEQRDTLFGLNRVTSSEPNYVALTGANTATATFTAPTTSTTLYFALLASENSFQSARIDRLSVTVAFETGLAVSVNNANVSEGGSAIFTVALTGTAPATPVTVDWTISGSTDNADYTLSGTDTDGTLRFTAVGSQTITANITDDTSGEEAETLTFTLSNLNGGGSGAGINTAEATTTIAGNDRTLTITGPATIAETDADTESGTYTITLTGPAFTTGFNTTVTWTVSHDATGGTSDADFAAASDRSGTVSFHFREGHGTTKTFTLTIAGDELNEDNEGFTVQASVADATADGGTTYGAAAATTITDDDGRTLTITGPVTLTETDADTESGTYTITLTNNAFTTDTTVTWTVSHDATGGTSDADFVAASDRSGTVSFGASDSPGATRTFTLTIAGDRLSEDGESFTVQASVADATSDGGTTFGAAAATTIAANDRPLTVQIEGPRITSLGSSVEGQADDFTVSFAESVTTTAAVEVDWAITFPAASDTVNPASAADFAATSGTVSIPAGMNTATLSISSTDDRANEDNERYTVTLSNPRGGGAIAEPALHATRSADALISSSDPVRVRLARRAGQTGAVREGTLAEFTVSLSFAADGSPGATSGGDICVPFEADVVSQAPVNTAGSGADIGGVSDCDGNPVQVRLTTLPNFAVASLADGGVLIPAGQSSATFSIDARFDGLEETANEDLIVEITDPMPRAGASSVTLARESLRSVSVPIVSANSLRTLSVTGPASLTETDGDLESGDYTITLSGAAFPAATTVTWTVSHAPTGGTGDGDFVAASDRSGTVTFADSDGNGATRTFTLTLAGDDLNEATEAFSVQVSVAESAAAGTEFGAAAMTTIADDDPISVSFARRASPVQAASVTEAASLELHFDYAITGGTRTGAVTLPFTIGGVANADFAITAPGGIAADATGGTVTLDTSDTSVTGGVISVTVTGNDLNEATRTLTLTGGTPVTVGAINYASASANTAEVTIGDDDAATVTLARSGGATDAVREGASADFTLALTRSGGGPVTSAADICVAFDTLVMNQQPPANDVTSGADIALPANCEGMAVTAAPATGAASGSVLIPAGQSSATLSIATRFDSVDEGGTNERLEVTLSGATARAGAGTVSHATGGMGMETAEIQNVNSLRTLAVSGPAAAVDEDGVTGAGQTVPVEFTITMDGTMQPATPVEVRWRLNLEEDGSISLPASGLGRSVEISDVSSPQTGSVTFGTGETFPIVRMVTVQVQQDALNEGAETLRLTLDAPPDDAGGQPDPNVPGTRVIADSAAAIIAASDDITVFLTADDTGTVTSGDDARYTLSFGTTMVNGQVVPIVPTTPITVPLTVRVGGDAVTVPDVVVQPGAASAPVVIPAAQINAQSRGAAAMIEVTAQAPTGAPGQGTPGGATAQVATTQDVTEETARRNMLSQTERERLGLVADVAMAQRPRQVAGWTVAISQPSADAPEGSDWNVVFTLGGDRAALGGNTITVPWSLAGRATGGAMSAAEPADFAASTATPPAYTCGANAEGACSTFPDGTVTFTASSQSQITVAIRVRDDGMAEGNDPQGFSLTLGTISGTAAAQTVTTGATTLQAAIPALRANLSVTDATAAEGQSAEFVLTLSGFNGGTETTQPITVAYTLTDGPATGGARSGEDFTPPATAAGVADCPASRICTVIPSGAREGTAHRISVPLILDGVLEPRETFTLTITDALRGGGNIRLVADAGADPVVVANEITATGTIGDDADQGARRRQRVSALVTVLDRQTALLATDAISARLSRARTDSAQSASLSIANRNLIGARNAARSGAGAVNAEGGNGANAAGAPNIGLALYGASGRGGAANLLGGGASAASLMSGSAGFGGPGAGLAGGANMGTRTALPSLAQVLNGSSFRFGAASDVLAGLANFADGIEVWGSGGYMDLRSESRSSGLTYDGESIAAFIGADAIVPQLPNLITGLAVGWSAGDLDFTDRAGGFTMRGKLENDALSVHPYFGWQLSPHANAWLVLGFGVGSVDIEENEGSGASAISRKLDGGDSAMLMFSTGITGTQQIGETGDLKLRFALTRVHSRVDSGRFDDGALLPKTRGRSLRFGGEAEAGRRITLDNGLSLRPFGTLRVRLDNASAEAGVENAAMDWGAGITAAWTDLGLDGRFAFRRQLNDTGDEEQGATLDVNFAPGATGQGIAISLQTALQQRRPGLSNLEDGLGNALLGANNALSNPLGGASNAFGASNASASADAGMQHSLSGEIAYGVAVRYFGRGDASRAALLTPYGRFHLGSADTRWAAGLRLAEPGGLQLGLEAGLHLNSAAAPAPAGPRYDILLTSRLPF